MKRAVKWTNTALIVGFAALLAGPNLLWPILRGSCDTVNHENRTLASFPDAETSLTQWPTAFEAWLSDNAPFRNEMLILKAESIEALARWILPMCCRGKMAGCF